MDYGWLPQIDTSALFKMGQGIANRQQRNDVAGAMTGDYAKDAETLLKMGLTDQARIVGALGEMRRRTDIDAFEAVAKAKAPPKMSAGQSKAFYGAQEKLPGLDNTISTLERAMELNPKTMDGWFASQRANIGARGPEWLSGAIGIDKNEALATEEWERLTTPEAIQKMGESFKGATTEKELMTMLHQVADTSIPKEIRKGILGRLITQAKAERDVYNRRIKILGPMAGEEAAPSGGGREPPQSAIEALNADPSLADQFEEWYGVPAEDYLLKE